MGRGLSSLGFSYKSIRILRDSGYFSYDFIGFPESGSLLEFLSTRLLLYHNKEDFDVSDFQTSHFGSSGATSASSLAFHPGA